MTAEVKGRQGFTLVELMVVVAIISLLAAMAIPQYNSFTCKAKQTEAKESLGMLAKCQEAYFFEYSTYSNSKGRIGFFMRGVPYYTYEIVSADQIGFNAKATAYHNERLDSWIIDEALILNNDQNGCRNQ